MRNMTFGLQIFSTFQHTNKVSVRWVSRMLTPNCTQVSEELLVQYECDPAKIYFTTRYSRWNVDEQLCNGTNESVKIVISLYCV